MTTEDLMKLDGSKMTLEQAAACVRTATMLLNKAEVRVLCADSVTKHAVKPIGEEAWAKSYGFEQAIRSHIRRLEERSKPSVPCDCSDDTSALSAEDRKDCTDCGGTGKVAAPAYFGAPK